MAKNANAGRYVYGGCCIGFDPRTEFILPGGSVGKNGIIFGVDMNSSIRIDHKIKHILILGKDPAKGLDDTTITAEAQ